MEQRQEGLKISKEYIQLSPGKENLDVMDTGSQQALEGNGPCCSNLI